MPIGNSDFARDFAIGAGVGNMRVMQQERMMQLRAQAALNAIHERQLAQEINIRAQAWQQKQEEDKQDEADLAGFSSLFKESVDTATAHAQMAADETGETVDPSKIQSQTLAFMLPSLATKNPRAAAKLVKSIQPVMANENRETVAGIREQALTNRTADSNATSLKRAEIGANSRQAVANTNAGAKLQAARMAADARIKADQTGGSKVSPAMRFALEQKQTRDALNEAYESGDPQAIQEATLLDRNLQQAMEKLHPNKQQAVRASMLMSKYRAALKAHYDDPEDKNLIQEIKTLEDEMSTTTKEMEPEVQKPPTSSTNSSALKVGRFTITPR